VDLGIDKRVFVVASRNEEDLAACGDVLGAEGAVVVGVDSIDGAVSEVIAGHGRLDGVIAHLRHERPRQLLDADLQELESAWAEVEAIAGAYREAAEAMAIQGRGRLVTVVSGGVKWLDDDTDEVGAIAGLGVLGLHKAAVADVAPGGICVNAVLRGARSTAHQVADAAAFLVSDGAGYLHGVTISLDGATSPAVF